MKPSLILALGALDLITAIIAWISIATGNLREMAFALLALLAIKGIWSILSS